MKPINDFEIFHEYPVILYRIGIFYMLGKNVKKDDNLAEKFLSKSAELGNASAMNSLAHIFTCQKNYGKAIELYEKALALQHPKATYNLGYLYVHGRVVEKDVKKGLELIEKSLLLGFLYSYTVFGKIHQYGRYGYKKDIIKALELYNIGAKLGGISAIKSLGRFYSENLDFDKAIYYYFLGLNTKYDKIKEYLIQKITTLITTQKIHWKPKYHKFWPKQPMLHTQILHLLLFCKPYNGKYLVPDICMIIIKYLCETRQLETSPTI